MPHTVNKTSFKKGQVPYNKGIYGEKVRNFRLGLPNFCKKHGLHKDWFYYEKNRMCACRLCRNERSRIFQANPDRRLNRLLKDAKKHAEQKKRNFDLELKDLEELLKKQNNKCAISEIKFEEGNGLYGYSLDRIDSNNGYVKDNVQLVCVIINRMKTDLPQNEFINICNIIALSAARKKKK